MSASGDPATQQAIDRVRGLLEAVVAGLRLDAQIELDEVDGEIQGVLIGEELGPVIGRQGQTIDAIQHLAFKVAVQNDPEPRRVVIDAAGYRDRRRTVLEHQADEAAGAAEASGSPVALEVMNAAERKLVHEYLKLRGGVETYSEGTEPKRHLVVAPLRFT